MEGLVVILVILILAVHVGPEEEEDKTYSGVTCIMASCRVTQTRDNSDE